MTERTPNTPNPEAGRVDPVQAARGTFNRELFASEYRGDKIIYAFGAFQTALLSSSQTPEAVFGTLQMFAGQAAARAEVQADADTQAYFANLAEGFANTMEMFATPAAATSKPAELNNLPLSGMKGNQDQVAQKKREGGEQTESKVKTPRKRARKPTTPDSSTGSTPQTS